MNVEAIRAAHGYSSWATRHILSCCDQLEPDQFTQDDDTPWGSIRNQLVHQFIVHKRWLSWADGSLSGEEAYSLHADPADYPDVASVRNMWADLEEQNDAFVARLDPDTLQYMLRIELPDGEFAIPVWQVMLHVAHHSMQHRTETAMSLSQLGRSPGDVDYLFYVLDGS